METHPLIVPDVNVLVSGTIISNSAPSILMQSWAEGIIEFATSEPILDELQRVLTYPRVVKITGMEGESVDKFINTIRQGSSIVPGTTTPVSISPDLDDNKFFACALEAQVDYIVSMDKRHVLSIGEYEGIRTIHPTDFIRNILQISRAA